MKEKSWRAMEAAKRGTMRNEKQIEVKDGK